MTMFIMGFLSGAVATGGGIIALMWRDWQECKRLSRRITERLEMMDTEETRARNSEGANT